MPVEHQGALCDFFLTVRQTYRSYCLNLMRDGCAAS